MQASSLQSREKEEFKDFEAGMELEGDSQSDTDSEVRRVFRKASCWPICR